MYSTIPLLCSAMAADSSPNDRPFEDDLDRLEAIVDQLETDPPPLDDALDAYEEGVTLAQRCLDRLDAAEQRMQELDVDNA